MRLIISLAICLMLFACSDSTDNTINTDPTDPTYPSTQDLLSETSASLLGLSGADFSYISSATIGSTNLNFTVNALSFCDGDLINPPAIVLKNQNIYGCVDNLSTELSLVENTLTISVAIPRVEIGIDVDSQAYVEFTADNLSFDINIPVTDNGNGTISLAESSPSITNFNWGVLGMDYTTNSKTLALVLSATQAMLGVLSTFVEPYLQVPVAPLVDDILVDYATMEVVAQ